MFIYERILSLVIFLVFLLIFAYLIQKNTKIKSLKKVLFFYTISLSIMGFFYNPYKTADLYRIFEQMKLYYEPLNFEQFFNWARHSSTFFGMFYFYLFSKIGIYRLLPATTAFIFYTIIFKILCKCEEQFKINGKDLMFIFLFIMAGGQYVDVISGIRCMLSMCIVSYCIYSEYFNEKKYLYHIPLYIMASLIHPATLVLSLLRLVYLLFESENNKYMKVFKFLFTSILIVAVAFIAKSQIYDALNKAEAYASYNIYSYTWEYIIAFIVMIYMFFVIRCYKRIDFENYKKNVNYIKFFKIVYAITFCLIFVYSIFHRYRSFLSMLFIPIIFMVYKKLEEDDNSKLRKNFNNVTLIVLMILFILVFVRGNLCGINFFTVTK